MKSFTFNVIQSDIDTGEPKMACHCPIALCAMRMFPNNTHVVVGPMSGCSRNWILYVQPSGEPDIRFLLPEIAIRFILSFDAGLRVSPITFEAQPISQEEYHRTLRHIQYES